ncbi:hypothetical protein LC593_14390 [Nostoc sp. CHAB 5844]|nr:hypothetical protein [Nostoc sp. CHAB 5844]
MLLKVKDSRFGAMLRVINAFGGLSISVLQLQNTQQFLLHSSQVWPIQLPQRLQQILDCIFQRI